MLCLSDKKIPQYQFTSWFNGINIPTKTDKYKFYYIDSCRGNEQWEVETDDPTVKPMGRPGDITGDHNDDIDFHPEGNHIILHGNVNKYRSYQMVYNEDSNDIDWELLKN